MDCADKIIFQQKWIAEIETQINLLNQELQKAIKDKNYKEFKQNFLLHNFGDDMNVKPLLDTMCIATDKADENIKNLKSRKDILRKVLGSLEKEK